MSLRERIETIGSDLTGLGGVRNAPVPSATADTRLRSRLHLQLLEQLDLAALQALPESTRREELGRLIEQLITAERVALNESERRLLIREIQDEVLGLGPLEPLLADPTISDILVNGPSTVYVERSGRLAPSAVQFSDSAHLRRIIDRIVSRVGRRIDESSPMVDARLTDGSRVNAIIPPIALDGPVLSIRRFSEIPLTMHDLVERYQSLTEPMAQLLRGLCLARINVVVSGGTGSGKTTLLNILSGFIPADQRIVTIEDAAELRLQQPHVVRLETRPPNAEGVGEITQRALVRNALRMRPDRIIIGEVRGAEAFDMLQAMNTGHEGSLTTIHANSARDALSRLENMIGMADLGLSPRAIRQQIASAIGVVIQALRLQDGRRRLVSIQEITGMEGEVITLQEIFRFVQTGIADDGAVQGEFRACGIRPRLTDRLSAFGIELGSSLFDPELSDAGHIR